MINNVISTFLKKTREKGGKEGEKEEKEGKNGREWKEEKKGGEENEEKEEKIPCQITAVAAASRTRALSVYCSF